MASRRRRCTCASCCDGGLKALEELKSAGVISAYGLGVNEVQVCLDVLRRAPLDCILLAGRYTLLDRTAEAELMPLCREKKTSLVVGGVFNSGILATGPVAGAHFDYGPATPEIQSKVSARWRRSRRGRLSAGGGRVGVSAARAGCRDRADRHGQGRPA